MVEGTRKRKQVSYNESDSDFMSDQEIRSRLAKTEKSKGLKDKKKKKKKKSNKKRAKMQESSPDEEEVLSDALPSEESAAHESEEDVTTKKKDKKSKKDKKEKKAKKEKKVKKEKKIKVEEKSDKEEEEAEEEHASEDEVVYNQDSISRSRISIPHPKGAPFLDSIAPSTLEFLAELAENNDRDFMRLKAKEWVDVKKDFVGFCKLLKDDIYEADPTIRVEEAAKAMYRQNRDLRFSNDKSPYKINLSAAFSRDGRKFRDAGYYLSIQPNNKSLIGAGMWQPDSAQLANMRSSIIRNGDLMREALSTDALKEAFDGKYGTDILTAEDKLKVAPRNIAKDHPEIELLRYRSFVIVKHFTDEEVVSEGFLDKVMDVIEASVPFVAVVNSWV